MGVGVLAYNKRLKVLFLSQTEKISPEGNSSSKKIGGWGFLSPLFRWKRPHNKGIELLTTGFEEFSFIPSFSRCNRRGTFVTLPLTLPFFSSCLLFPSSRGQLELSPTLHCLPSCCAKQHLGQPAELESGPKKKKRREGGDWLERR